MSNLTVAGGGERTLKDGMYAVRLGQVARINEIPNSGVGPNGKYKKFLIMGTKYSFEGFGLEYKSNITMVFDTEQEAVDFVNKGRRK